MPKLKIMLRNCGFGDACLLRYDTTNASSESVCVLTWRSNWAPELTLQPDVIEAWKKVAVANGFYNYFLSHNPLRVDRCPLPTTQEYLSYGSILKYLKLTYIMLHHLCCASS